VVIVVKLKPAVYPIKALLHGDVIDEDRAVCITDVIGHQAFELLLPGSIPQLKPVDRALVVYILDEKVNANCFLDY
jgi:hypothetical protein